MMQLLSYWNIDIGLMVLLSVLIILFVFFNKSAPSKVIYLFAAIAICIVCFFSPLAVLSTSYLFSAHMTVHVLLLLCVAPLLLLTFPANKLFSSIFSYISKKPVAAWLSGVGIMWFWHVPVIFNTAMNMQLMHIMHYAEIISLLFAGILFAAPVIHPNKKYRLDALSGVVYLFTACIGCSLLGLLITFAPAATYKHFLSHDVYGLNDIILHKWNITQQSDQQAAGLIMWVPCCLIYVSGAMYLLMQWFHQKEELPVELNKT